MKVLPIVHNPAYVADFPSDHRFPMGKFGRLADLLLQDGLVAPGAFHEPAAAPAEWIALAHDRTYVDQVLSAQVPVKIAREIGFPMTESVARRSRTASAGTLITARLALEHGIACNTAGGSHHARRTHGSGFCVFNDVAVAASVLLADGEIDRALVIDLDVHQGDGTAHIFQAEPRVYTFSMHAEKNFPVRKVPSDWDVGLPDGLGDQGYLKALGEHLPHVLEQSEPELVFYNAGVDVHQEDRLGRLALSDAGIEARDRFVLTTLKDAGVPAACVIGGGYMSDVDRLARRHSIIHRVASDIIC